VDVNEIKGIISVPATFGKKVEMILLPFEEVKEDGRTHSHKLKAASEAMMTLQQESGFSTEILSDEKEDVWNNV